MIGRWCRAVHLCDAIAYVASSKKGRTPGPGHTGKSGIEASVIGDACGPGMAAAISDAACQRMLAACTGFWDPLVADWTLTPDDRSGGRQTSLDTLGCTFEALASTGPNAPFARLMCSKIIQEGNQSRSGGGSDRWRLRRGLAVLLVTCTGLLPRLQTAGTLTAFATIEVPLVPSLIHLEFQGFALATDYLQVVVKAMQERVRIVESEAAADTKRTDWALSNPQQCATMLFDVLKLPSLEETDTARHLNSMRRGKAARSGLKETRSTKQTVLQQLQRLYPEVRLPFIIQEYRTLTGWEEKFIRPLLDDADPSRFIAAASNKPKVTTVVAATRGSGATAPRETAQLEVAAAAPLPRIRGQYFHTATATGRLAMGEPNLQTIPHPIAFQLAPPDSPVLPLRIRDAFVATGRGSPYTVILVADYAQIEARLLAHFSGDVDLCSAFADGAGDVFVALAAKVFRTEPVLLAEPTNGGDSLSNISARVPPPSVATDPTHEAGGRRGVTAAQRRQCKTLCYGMLYGRGAGSIAEELGMPVEEAQELLATFRSTYRGATAYLRTVADQALKDGYVASITGRRRYLPAVSVAASGGGAGHHDRMKAAVERIAVNTRCQASAADLVKLAMVRLARAFAELPSVTCPAVPAARVVHQVHDELVIEADGAMADHIADVTRRVMSGVVGAFRLSVPFPVKVQRGTSWGRATSSD
jgi:DNA polymerase I-like protein with 3'-5' exonuclease and polymerase domains